MSLLAATDPALRKRWEETLDALFDAARSGAHVAIPDDLGPLPPELLARATAVLAEQRRAEAELTTRRDEVAAELASLHRSRPSRQVTQATRTSTFGAVL